MGLKRDAKSRQKRQSLRSEFIDNKPFSKKGWASKKSEKLYGTEAAVYCINARYYTGKVSTDPYLQTLKCL